MEAVRRVRCRGTGVRLFPRMSGRTSLPAPLGARWRFSPALAEFEAYLEQGRPRHVNEPANLCGHTHTAGADSCATTGETDFYETPVLDGLVRGDRRGR